MIKTIRKNKRVVLTIAGMLLFGAECRAQYDELDDPLIRELEDRALEVTRNYPWLVQTPSGLSLNAISLSREELLKGIHAATDLVFDGTENLDPTLDLAGHFQNIEAALNTLCRPDPYLTCEIDFSTSRATFDRLPDPTVGMSEVGLIARYRQVRIDPSLTRRNYGAYLPGMFIYNGSHFPAPFEFKIEPFPEDSKVAFSVNGFTVADYEYLDPMEVDRNLYEAKNTPELKEALRVKLDQSWRMTSRFPVGATPEVLSLLSRQAQFLYGVVRSEPMLDGMRLHLSGGEKLDWTFPKPSDGLAFDAPDAYRKAQELQSLTVSALSLGKVVFVSERFGVHVLEQSYSFPNEMQRILLNDLPLSGKEREIRTSWPSQSDSILEYFYTSLVPDDWMKAQPVQKELVPNSDNIAPAFETPAEKRIQAAIDETLGESNGVQVPPSLLPIGEPREGRGLLEAGSPTIDFSEEEGNSSNQTPVRIPDTVPIDGESDNGQP